MPGELASSSLKEASRPSTSMCFDINSTAQPGATVVCDQLWQWHCGDCRAFRKRDPIHDLHGSVVENGGRQGFRGIVLRRVCQLRPRPGAMVGPVVWIPIRAFGARMTKRETMLIFDHFPDRVFVMHPQHVSRTAWVEIAPLGPRSPMTHVTAGLPKVGKAALDGHLCGRWRLAIAAEPSREMLANTGRRSSCSPASPRSVGGAQ